jgi:hypothetical protein
MSHVDKALSLKLLAMQQQPVEVAGQAGRVAENNGQAGRATGPSWQAGSRVDAEQSPVSCRAVYAISRVSQVPSGCAFALQRRYACVGRLRNSANSPTRRVAHRAPPLSCIFRSGDEPFASARHTSVRCSIPAEGRKPCCHGSSSDKFQSKDSNFLLACVWCACGDRMARILEKCVSARKQR